MTPKNKVWFCKVLQLTVAQIFCLVFEERQLPANSIPEAKQLEEEKGTPILDFSF